MKAPSVNSRRSFFVGGIPEEGSPPPSSPPDINLRLSTARPPLRANPQVESPRPRVPPPWAVFLPLFLISESSQLRGSSTQFKGPAFRKSDRTSLYVLIRVPPLPTKQI